MRETLGRLVEVSKRRPAERRLCCPVCERPMVELRAGVLRCTNDSPYCASFSTTTLTALVVERPAVPWEYSKAPKPGEQTVENLPTPEGAELGRALAALADLEEAEQRERFPNMLPRCSDCALRLGTLPNQCLEPLLDVIKCSIEGQPFYCHKGLKEGEAPKRLCTGAMVLMNGERLRRFFAELGSRP